MQRSVQPQARPGAEMSMGQKVAGDMEGRLP